MPVGLTRPETLHRSCLDLIRPILKLDRFFKKMVALRLLRRQMLLQVGRLKHHAPIHVEVRLHCYAYNEPPRSGLQWTWNWPKRTRQYEAVLKSCSEKPTL